MGRRSVRVDQPERWVFNRLAAAYRSRPPYPDALVDRLAALAGGAGARIVDLGAGTGHIAIPLAERGLAVTAVEPAEAMLTALRTTARGSTAERLTPVLAAAEATGLPPRSFDLVLVADALHWIDVELAGTESARLLGAGGVVAVVDASFADTPFMAALAKLLARANPKARPRPEGALRQFLAHATASTGREVAARTERFVHACVLDDDALAQVLRSLSHVGPALAPERLEALLSDASALARTSGGARWTRELTLTWAVRRRTPAWTPGSHGPSRGHRTLRSGTRTDGASDGAARHGDVAPRAGTLQAKKATCAS